jgi:membrane associated rhomboid family serine protease
MMALLTTLLPRARIWCLFWFLLWVRRFSIPVMWVSLWFLGWNVYDLNHDDGSSNINYMAHVSGALAGIALGVLYRLFSPNRLVGLSMNTA